MNYFGTRKRINVKNKYTKTFIQKSDEVKYFMFEIHVDAECRDTKHIEQAIKHFAKEYSYMGESFPFSRTRLFKAYLKNDDARKIETLDTGIKAIKIKEVAIAN